MGKKKDTTPDMLSQSLPQLQDTGNPLGDVNMNMKNLQSQYYPGMLPTFQKVMGGIAERVYQQRQSSDMNAITPYFNPTQVSGGTMSSVLGWLEGNRGRTVSDLYKTTMQAYQKTQDWIGSELSTLRTLRYNIQNNVQQFKWDMVKNMPGVYESLSDKEKKSIETGSPVKSVYLQLDEWSKDVDERNKKWQDEQRQMAKEEHDLRMQEGSTSQKKADYITNIMGAMNTLAERRHGTYTNEEINNQEMIDQGIAPGKTTGTSESKLYNTVDDYWTSFFQVMNASSEADPVEVQSFLSKFLSPSDRVAVDISGRVSSGIEGMRAAVDQMERQYGKDAMETGVGGNGEIVNDTLLNKYWDAKWDLMTQGQ